MDDPFNRFMLSLLFVGVLLSVWFAAVSPEPEPEVLICDELVVELKDSTWVRLTCNDGSEAWGLRR